MLRYLRANKLRQVPLALPAVSHWPDITLGIILAFFVPCFAAYQGTFARVDGQALLVCFGIIIAISVIASAVLFKHKAHIFAATLASSAICLTALATHGLITGVELRNAAKAFAQGKPYCIQSANRKVSQIVDLMVLNLRATTAGGGTYLNYHALLVVREGGTNQFYNWSYRRNRFEHAEMTYAPDVVCSP
jgi:hypothetical protein